MAQQVGSPNPEVYPFDYAHAGDYRSVAQIVGGKGASLWALSRLGIPVPEGFSIGTSECHRFLQSGMSDDLRTTIRTRLRAVEASTGRRFGDPERPLLVSVRSGAPISMPGMMDTILNVGLTDATRAGLARSSRDEAFALDTYARFLNAFATTVLGAMVPVTDAHHAIAARYPTCLDDPFEQLEVAIEAVFRSWHSPRATAYRAHEGIPEHLGTAVTVQAMVFGNADARSGTGVVFTRDPSSGEAKPRGDFLVCAQGEDVVAGTHRTLGLDDLAHGFPEVYAELRDVMHRLETYYRDMCDIEFTIERGKLWILQSRVGKRSPAAAARIAVELHREGRLDISRSDAIARVPPGLLDAHTPERRRVAGDRRALARGIAASPGVATGLLVFDPDRAVERADDGDDVILTRRETSPEDVHGMSVARGIVTAFGGEMSHAAVVAREWGIPAVCGVEALAFAGDTVTFGATACREGDLVTIDGSTGEIFLGRTNTVVAADPYVEILRKWARDTTL